MVSLIFAFGKVAKSAGLALALACSTASATENVARALDRTMQAEVAHGFSGAVYAMRGDAVLLDRGYGAMLGVPVRADSKFWIASAGKQFVSAAILKCSDRGLLSLNDPLSRFFPEAPEDKRGVTVRQLLAHLSGFDQAYVADEAPDRETAVQRILALPLIDRPGARFHYANDNYELAAAIVEVAAHDEYRRFVRTNLFRPAGLNDTGFAGMPGARTVLPARNAPPRLFKRVWGEATVYSTTRDLSRWYRALQLGRILSRAGTEELFKPAAPIHEGQTALGWFIGRSPLGGKTIFTRGNEDFGANSLLYAYPERGVLVVVLTHSGMASDDLSWSRRVLGDIELALFTPPKRNGR